MKCQVLLIEMKKRIKEIIEKYSKIYDKNNVSYTDGFFSYLSSILLNKFNFLNGLDFYDIFLGNKNNFKVDITDDLEYLEDSEFFHKNLDNKFLFDKNVNISKIFNNTRKYKKELKLENLDDNEELLEDVIDLSIDLNESKLTEKNLEKLELKLEYDVEELDKKTSKSELCDSETVSNTCKSKNTDGNSKKKQMKLKNRVLLEVQTLKIHKIQIQMKVIVKRKVNLNQVKVHKKKKKIFFVQ